MLQSHANVTIWAGDQSDGDVLVRFIVGLFFRDFSHFSHYKYFRMILITDRKLKFVHIKGKEGLNLGGMDFGLDLVVPRHENVGTVDFGSLTLKHFRFFESIYIRIRFSVLSSPFRSGRDHGIRGRKDFPCQLRDFLRIRRMVIFGELLHFIEQNILF